MNILELGAIGELVGGVAVIGSLIFVGFQLRQATAAQRGAAVDALRRIRNVNEWSERNLYFGGVHAVNPAGEGAGDPRREGHGSVVDAP